MNDDPLFHLAMALAALEAERTRRPEAYQFDYDHMVAQVRAAISYYRMWVVDANIVALPTTHYPDEYRID